MIRLIVVYLVLLVTAVIAQAPDVAPPVISNILVSNIQATGVTITWTTDEPGTTRVQYGVNPNYSNARSVSGFTVEHRVVLSALLANTLYHYRVHSKDVSGNWAVSCDFIFQTSEVTPTPTPTPTPVPTPTPPPVPGATPELPRVFLDTTYVNPTGTIFMVPSGGNLQSVINQAQPGDAIVLPAGSTFAGNFTLPNKIGSGWITIRTESDLPIGVRVSPVSSPSLAKLVSPNADPVVQTTSGAHHYRFVGIEFGATSDIFNIVALGEDQTTMSATPHDLIIDRCYVHGNPTSNSRRGVLINSSSTSIIDSYISDIHEVGADAQAVCGWNGPGPFKIVDNYLEGSGENFMLGGAPASLAGLIASDVEFRLNYVRKPLQWKKNDPSYSGHPWSIKNLFELKNAQRVLVDGNLFENNWADSQNGFAILFTPRGEDGTTPQATASDVTFTNNTLIHSGSGFNIAGPDDTSPSQPSHRILIRNNLIDDINGVRWTSNSTIPADGRAFQCVGGPVNIAIDHNTVFQSGPIMVADGAPTVGLTYTNNIAPHNDYGFLGSGFCCGNVTLDHYFPGAIFLKNVIIGVIPGVSYPPNNFFPSSVDQVGFTNFAGGDYRLTSTSPYKNAGTDGKDIGRYQ